jgi:ABC-type transport system involved in multi-copper enzyme maturation permease subunit
MTAALTRRLFARLWPLLVIPPVLAMGLSYLFIALIEPLGGVGILQTVLRMTPRIGQLLGSNEIDPTSSAGIASIAYVHPLMSFLLLVWPLALASSTLGGDVESGEADLILSRAVPRRSMFLAALLALVASAVLMAAAAWCGTALGAAHARHEQAIPLLRFAGAASVNAILVLATGGALLLLSACSSDRGRILGLGALLWVANFFCGAVAPLFESLAFLQRFSIQGHARPQAIVATGLFPWGDTALLACIAIASASAAAWIWSRRDLRS